MDVTLLIVVAAALGIAAYIFKIKLKRVLLAYAGFAAASFLWGTVTDSFGVVPSDTWTSILYALGAFAVFFIIWERWLKRYAS